MSFVKEVNTQGRNKLTTDQKKKASELIEKNRKEDAKLVKGVFKNLECPGGDLTFAYHQYKGEPTRIYHLLDGKEYEIPIGVAKHINRSCKYTKKAHNPNILQKGLDGDWRPIEGKPVERYQFISTDFM